MSARCAGSAGGPPSLTDALCSVVLQWTSPACPRLPRTPRAGKTPPWRRRSLREKRPPLCVRRSRRDIPNSSRSLCRLVSSGSR